MHIHNIDVYIEALELSNIDVISTRPSSKSVPQRGENIKEQHKEKKAESPLPVIERIDIEPKMKTDPPQNINTNYEEIPPPPPPQKSMWQPLAEMYVQ